MLRQRREQLADEPTDSDSASRTPGAPDEAVQVYLPDVDNRLTASELTTTDLGRAVGRDAFWPRSSDSLYDGNMEAVGEVDELKDVRPAEGTAEVEVG